MPKNITSEVREIILKVKEFMDEEKRMQVPIIPLSKVYVRVSAATGPSSTMLLRRLMEDVQHILAECVQNRHLRDALVNSLNLNTMDIGVFQTILAKPNSEQAKKMYDFINASLKGVSERTVLNIVKEARLVEQGLLDPEILKRAPKKRVRTKGKIEVDEYDLQVIRRKIHEFYAYKKEVPTINKLLQILKEEINFKGSRETLRKILRKNGFQFRKTKNNKEKEPVPESTSSVPPMVPPYIHTMFSHKNIQS